MQEERRQARQGQQRLQRRSPVHQTCCSCCRVLQLRCWRWPLRLLHGCGCVAVRSCAVNGTVNGTASSTHLHMAWEHSACTNTLGKGRENIWRWNIGEHRCHDRDLQAGMRCYKHRQAQGRLGKEALCVGTGSGAAAGRDPSWAAGSSMLLSAPSSVCLCAMQSLCFTPAPRKLLLPHAA